jgi:hypothetical protein
MKNSIMSISIDTCDVRRVVLMKRSINGRWDRHNWGRSRKHRRSPSLIANSKAKSLANTLANSSGGFPALIARHKGCFNPRDVIRVPRPSGDAFGAIPARLRTSLEPKFFSFR